MRTSLDNFAMRPEEMTAYLSHNGWHFNKKASDYASSMMYKKNKATGKKEYIEPYTKEDVKTLLSKYHIELDEDIAYDSVYVANMAKSDFWGSSIEDELHLARYIKDVIDDPDAADGTIMRRWYASMVASGCPVEWSDII